MITSYSILPVDDSQLLSGIFKLKDMIRNAKTRLDLEKLLPYYHIVMAQITRIENKDISIRKYEKTYDMYWEKYNKIPG